MDIVINVVPNFVALAAIVVVVFAAKVPACPAITGTKNTKAIIAIAASIFPIPLFEPAGIGVIIMSSLPTDSSSSSSPTNSFPLCKVKSVPFS